MRYSRLVVLMLSGCYLSHGRSERDAGYDAGVECIPQGIMVPVTTDHAYRLDATEVTQREYNRFLRCAPSAPVASVCPPIDHHPSSEGECRGVVFDPDALGTLPVRCVSWCSAGAYCAWAGKRLCTLQEWMPACHSTRDRVAVGMRINDPRACVLSAYADGVWGTGPADGPVPVGSAVNCRGAEPPFDEVFDILGNVGELIVVPGSPPSFQIGYSYTAGPNSPCREEGSVEVEQTGSAFGFRCCGD